MTENIPRNNSEIVVRERRGFPWHGRCAIGVYPGERTFENGSRVRGVFGMTGLEQPCVAPITARCQLMIDGRLRPYFWLACDNPEHRLNAGVIEHLDAEGYVVRVERCLPLPMPVEQAVVAVAELPPKKRKRKRSVKKRGKAKS